jgi:hypothetical protein
MKLQRLLATATATAGVTTLLIRAYQIACERDVLEARLHELQDRYYQIPIETRRRIAGHNKQPYRIPDTGVRSATLHTIMGEVTLSVAGGDYAGTAIFVYFAEGVGFPQEIADAFVAETKGEFQMDRAPSTRSGGDDDADAIISVGLNPTRYRAGTQSYFKSSSAPRLGEACDVLSRVISNITS